MGRKRAYRVREAASKAAHPCPQPAHSQAPDPVSAARLSPDCLALCFPLLRWWRSRACMQPPTAGARPAWMSFWQNPDFAQVLSPHAPLTEAPSPRSETAASCQQHYKAFDLHVTGPLARSCRASAELHTFWVAASLLSLETRSSHAPRPPPETLGNILLSIGDLTQAAIRPHRGCRAHTLPSRSPVLHPQMPCPRGIRSCRATESIVCCCRFVVAWRWTAASPSEAGPEHIRPAIQWTPVDTSCSR